MWSSFPVQKITVLTLDEVAKSAIKENIVKILTGNQGLKKKTRVFIRN